jgi:hypothetical protein
MTNQQKEIARAISLAHSELSDLEDIIEENSLSQSDCWKIGDLLEKAISAVVSAQEIINPNDEDDE